MYLLREKLIGEALQYVDCFCSISKQLFNIQCIHKLMTCYQIIYAQCDYACAACRARKNSTRALYIDINHFKYTSCVKSSYYSSLLLLILNALISS